MDAFKIVFATDDGTSFMDRHFGDAEYFDLYEVSTEDVQFIKRIENNAFKRDGKYAIGQKAAGIAGLFKKDNVHVLVSKKFGANINKMNTKYVCLLMNDNQISDSIAKIQDKFDRIKKEWDKGESRHFINLKM